MLLDRRVATVLHARRPDVVRKVVKRQAANGFGDCELPLDAVALERSAEVGGPASRWRVQISCVNVGLRDEEVVVCRARDQELAGGCEDLGAGLKLVASRLRSETAMGQKMISTVWCSGARTWPSRRG